MSYKSDDFGKLVVIYDGMNVDAVRKAFLHVAVGRCWIEHFLKNPGTQKQIETITRDKDSSSESQAAESKKRAQKGVNWRCSSR